MITRIAAIIAFYAAGWSFAAAGTELVMVEEPGCVYCARWNAEIGPIYPKTEEGKAAPLRRVDLTDGLPKDLRFKTRPVYTPTFILMQDGQELHRIEGYPGEDFFWGLLDKMLEQTAQERSGS